MFSKTFDIHSPLLIIFFILTQIIDLSSSIVICDHSSFVNCTNEGSLCSEDGTTFESECDFRYAQCDGKEIKIAYNEACSKCRTEVYQKSQENKQKDPIYLPKCDKNTGLYLHTQCHEEKNICWCVEEASGKLIPETSKPREEHQNNYCKKLSKVGNNRNGKNKCSRKEREKFVDKMINELTKEYEEAVGGKEDVRTVLKWKFAILDVNSDKVLNRDEIRGMRRMIKNQTRTPRRCGRAFFRHIDRDMDKVITKMEWISYFLHINLDSSISNSTLIWSLNESESSFERSPIWTKKDLERLDEDNNSNEEDMEEGGDIDRIQMQPNCSSLRAKRLAEAKNAPNSKIFIPGCNPDNPELYDEVQCFINAGFCFCVRPKDGIVARGPRIWTRYPAKPICSQRLANSKV
ncbi:SPARC related modular calcium binding-like protein magu [Brevipalpus obovatus]|uniref:SPARC related modular calcium binding-like protein magu n=1 Tax=Brevipalpus obovatus TaxID=246614 RepID=UPI003D9ED4F0